MQDPDLQEDLIRRLEKHTIVSLKHLQALHLTVSALMIEVAAIRQAAFTSKRAQVRYKNQLAKAMKTARPILKEATDYFADQINSVSSHIQSEQQTSIRLH